MSREKTYLTWEYFLLAVVIGLIAGSVAIYSNQKNLTANISQPGHINYDDTWKYLESILGAKPTRMCSSGEIQGLGNRIAYNPGAVNQHFDIIAQLLYGNGRVSDTDGTAGSHINNKFPNDRGNNPMGYCKKVYPNLKITGVTRCGCLETLTFKAKGNVGSYTKTVPAICCQTQGGYYYGYGYGYNTGYGYGYGHGMIVTKGGKKPYLYLLKPMGQITKSTYDHLTETFGIVIFRSKQDKKPLLVLPKYPGHIPQSFDTNSYIKEIKSLLKSNERRQATKGAISPDLTTKKK